MDDIIQKLVDVDHECVAKIKSAQEKKADIQNNLSSKKKEIYEEFLKEQKIAIEKHKNDLIAKNKEIISKQDETYKSTLIKLENLYNENKDKWVNDIVERCLK